jgi:hypothetical protein
MTFGAMAVNNGGAFVDIEEAELFYVEVEGAATYIVPLSATSYVPSNGFLFGYPAWLSVDPLPCISFIGTVAQHSLPHAFWISLS